MSMLRLLRISWLACAIAGCSALRDPDPDLRGDGVERTCSATPVDMLAEKQRASPIGARHDLDYPLRIGLFFLPAPGNKLRAVPTLAQQNSALGAIRGMLVAKPYVEEVIIVPTPFLGHAAKETVNRIQAISQRFDFDLVALLSCSQITHEFRNLRSQGWITFVGDRVWLGDVDQAETFLSLTVIEPVSLRTLTFANGQADWGDTTSAIDDWRSPDHVRQGSFDRALDNLLSNFIGASFALEPALQRPR
jgi:rhombotail lipoprotein